MAVRCKAWTVFACLNIGIVCSNLTRAMDVCVRLFCLGSGLVTGWSPVHGALVTVYRIKKLKSGHGPKGCKAIKTEPLIIIHSLRGCNGVQRLPEWRGEWVHRPHISSTPISKPSSQRLFKVQSGNDVTVPVVLWGGAVSTPPEL
jgi:hypothetical protein